MLAGMQRNVDADAAAKFAAPHAARHHNLVGVDGAIGGFDAIGTALSVRMRVTLVFSKILAPRVRAPAASACVTSIGFTWPSLGRNTPPLTFSML
jgi:hypothetical protein